MEYFKNQTEIMTLDETANYFPSVRAGNYRRDQESDFALAGLLSGSSHLTLWYSRWLDSLFLLPFGRRARSSDSLLLLAYESQGLSSALALLGY